MKRTSSKLFFFFYCRSQDPPILRNPTDSPTSKCPRHLGYRPCPPSQLRCCCYSFGRFWKQMVFFFLEGSFTETFFLRLLSSPCASKTNLAAEPSSGPERSQSSSAPPRAPPPLPCSNHSSGIGQFEKCLSEMSDESMAQLSFFLPPGRSRTLRTAGPSTLGQSINLASKFALTTQ